MRGGLIIALIVASIVAFGFYSAAQSITQKLASYRPASANVEGLAGPRISRGVAEHKARADLTLNNMVNRTNHGGYLHG